MKCDLFEQCWELCETEALGDLDISTFDSFLDVVYAEQICQEIDENHIGDAGAGPLDCLPALRDDENGQERFEDYFHYSRAQI